MSMRSAVKALAHCISSVQHARYRGSGGKCVEMIEVIKTGSPPKASSVKIFNTEVATLCSQVAPGRGVARKDRLKNCHFGKDATRPLRNGRRWLCSFD